MLDTLFVRTQSQLKHAYKLGIALILCFAISAHAPHCEAQYFGSGLGFGYNGLGSGLLYPLNSLFYSGYGNSLYGFAALGSGFANNALYNTYRNIPYGYTGNYPYNNNYGNYSGNNYPLGTTPNTNYPFNYNNYNNLNQNLPSGWNYSPNQTFPTSPASNDPNDIFNSRTPSNTSDPNSPSKTALPALAPDRHILGQTSNEMISASYTANARVFALEGFFQTVNTRYKGNLFRALDQPDMQCWAVSIGLIHQGQILSNNITQSRKNAVATIVKDTSLDAQKKIDILSSLLEEHPLR
jgi:hypothetical protein